MCEDNKLISYLSIRAVSLRNLAWKLANYTKSAKGDLASLFARVKQMNGIDDDKCWSKYPPWKQTKYDCDNKFYEAAQKLKSSLHIASREEWQTDYDTPSELSQYYSTTQRKLYGGKYSQSSEIFNE